MMRRPAHAHPKDEWPLWLRRDSARCQDALLRKPKEHTTPPVAFWLPVRSGCGPTPPPDASKTVTCKDIRKRLGLMHPSLKRKSAFTSFQFRLQPFADRLPPAPEPSVFPLSTKIVVKTMKSDVSGLSHPLPLSRSHTDQTPRVASSRDASSSHVLTSHSFR